MPAVLQHQRGRALRLLPRRPARLHVLCVVEEPRDIVAVERTHEFRGRYHVLRARSRRSRASAPSSCASRSCWPRVDDEGVTEVILATNPNIEGEATAMYLARLLKPLGVRSHPHRERAPGRRRPRVRRRGHARPCARRPPRGRRLRSTRPIA